MRLDNKRKKVIIIGSGGHAKVVYDALSKSTLNIIAIMDIKKKLNEFFYPLNLIGENDLLIKNYPKDKFILCNGLGMINVKSNKRKQVYDKLKKRGFSFLTIKHKFSFVSESSIILEGAQIMAGAIVQNSSVIGKNTIINTNASVDHDCDINDNCHIAPGAILNGNVIIESGSFIGSGSVVKESIKIKKNSIIGAGVTVFKDTLPNSKIVK